MDKISITLDSLKRQVYLRVGEYTSRMTRNEAIGLAKELLEMTERRNAQASEARILALLDSPEMIDKKDAELKPKAVEDFFDDTDYNTAFGGGDSDCPLLQSIGKNIIYPQSISGKDEISYEQRTPYMNGWNDATMQITKNYNKIMEELKPKKVDVEKIAKVICQACDENPDHSGDARGNAKTAPEKDITK
jgi:hypothetical protein